MFLIARKKDKYTLDGGQGKGKELESELESGAISACAVADGTPSGVLPLKIVSQCREQAGQVYNVSVFEIEQEIPMQIGLVLWGGGGIAVQRRGRAEATLPEARRDNKLFFPRTPRSG